LLLAPADELITVTGQRKAGTPKLHESQRRSILTRWEAIQERGELRGVRWYQPALAVDADDRWRSEEGGADVDVLD
jgi:hypothetical protein